MQTIWPEFSEDIQEFRRWNFGINREETKMRFDAEKGIIIAGHRGNPAEFTENTLESFKSAVDLGVDMIETDSHTTKDGKLVLMHDDSA